MWKLKGKFWLVKPPKIYCGKQWKIQIISGYYLLEMIKGLQTGSSINTGSTRLRTFNLIKYKNNNINLNSERSKLCISPTCNLFSWGINTNTSICGQLVDLCKHSVIQHSQFLSRSFVNFPVWLWVLGVIDRILENASWNWTTVCLLHQASFILHYICYILYYFVFTSCVMTAY